MGIIDKILAAAKGTETQPPAKPEDQGAKPADPATEPKEQVTDPVTTQDGEEKKLAAINATVDRFTQFVENEALITAHIEHLEAQNAEKDKLIAQLQSTQTQSYDVIVDRLAKLSGTIGTQNVERQAEQAKTEALRAKGSGMSWIDELAQQYAEEEKKGGQQDV